MVGIATALALAFAALYSSYRHGWSVADSSWRARRAEQGEPQAKTGQRVESLVRAEELRRQSAVDEIRTDAKAQSQAVDTVAADTDVTGERVHDAADRLAATAGGCVSDPGVVRLRRSSHPRRNGALRPSRLMLERESWLKLTTELE
ncbi:DUF2514 family protein [Pseudomonas fluorescens]|uniref:DUF2514 family protein n=1 Tax=Pseudomonas fluorescens TaxID=294 RepID=UPI00338F80DD